MRVQAKMMGWLACVVDKLPRANMCNVAVRANKNPRPFARNKLRCVRTAQTIEKPGAVVEPSVGHAIAGMQISQRGARGERARSVM